LESNEASSGRKLERKERIEEKLVNTKEMQERISGRLACGDNLKKKSQSRSLRTIDRESRE